MFALLSPSLRHVSACACAVHSISSSAHTLDRRPPRTTHLHVATAIPPASLPSTPVAIVPTCLLSYQDSPVDALSATPTSPPHLAQTSPWPLLASSRSPFCFFLFLLQVYLRAIASKFGRHNSPRRAPTRGAPPNCQSLSDRKPASSRQRPLEFATAHYDLNSSRRFALRRAPTRGPLPDSGSLTKIFSNLMQLP